MKIKTEKKTTEGKMWGKSDRRKKTIGAKVSSCESDPSSKIDAVQKCPLVHIRHLS